MSVVDPLAWLPLAVIWAVTMGACWLFVSDVNRGHIEPVGWLTAMVWFMGTVVGIPVALEYVTSTPLYEWAYRTNSGVYIGSVPTPFQPVLVIFVSFMKLKSDLADSIRIYRLHQTIDFGGTAPGIGAKDVCPCCGQYIQEGLLH
jgi:hypothetical protein